MSAIWDGDTGILTFTADKNGAPVNLSATTSRMLITRDVDSGVVATFATTPGDLTVGVVTADLSALTASVYHYVLRLVDANGKVVTYPTADVGPETLTKRAALDAV